MGIKPPAADARTAQDAARGADATPIALLAALASQALGRDGGHGRTVIGVQLHALLLQARPLRGGASRQVVTAAAAGVYRCHGCGTARLMHQLDGRQGEGARLAAASLSSLQLHTFDACGKAVAPWRGCTGVWREWNRGAPATHHHDVAATQQQGDGLVLDG